MNSDQKKVAIGAASGVITMAVLVGILFYLLPTSQGMDTMSARIAYTLCMNVIAAIPLFIGMIFVGNGRFLSDAIDPLRHAENRALEINGRFVDNTLQQNFFFLIGTLALSTLLSSSAMQLITALTFVYIAARIIFWIGYRMHPLYRAPGMAATSYMNLGIIVSVVLLFLW